MTDIISANSIDYRNVDEICAYRFLLCKIYECEGGFNFPPNNTATTHEISRQCHIWLREVKALIDSILRGDVSHANIGDIPRLIQSYDFFYRLSNGSTCYDYLREVKLRTADRRAKGDMSISQTDVALLLLSEADCNIRRLEERHAKYALSVMSSWLDELVKHGEFKDISLSETYKRLSYLLNANLYAYLSRKDEAKAKSQWVSRHLLTEEQLATTNTETLWDYAKYIDSIPFSSQNEFERNNSMYMHTLSILASRSDVHPYLVKAIELMFKRHEALIA